MRSMTGFGRGSADFGDGRVILEIKTVNHRFLEIRSRAQRELIAGEAFIEPLLRSRLGRGYCTVNLFYEGDLGGSTVIDQGALKNHLKSLIEVGEEFELCLADLIPTLAGAPDIFITPRPADEEALKAAVERAFEEAISGLLKMREAEGSAMAEDFFARCKVLTESTADIATLAESWPKLALERTRERINTLLTDIKSELDVGRVEAEAALLVDRADITEEITRLRSHMEQLASLTETAEPVGRKAEFLIQEIGREVNTIGSKAALDEIPPLVIKMKTELEKVRELVQNIE